MAHPTPGVMIPKVLFCTMSDSSFDTEILEKIKIFVSIVNTFTCVKAVSPIVFCTRSPGVMILTNLLLYHIKMLSCKFQLFWQSSFYQMIFQWPPHFCDYLHFKEDMAPYLNELEFPLPKDKLYQA